MGFPWRQVLSAGINVGTQIASAATGISAISLIPGLIIAADQAFAGQTGTGEQKKAVVLNSVMTAICVAEGITKKDLVDNTAAMDAIDGLIEHSLALMKAIHK